MSITFVIYDDLDMGAKDSLPDNIGLLTQMLIKRDKQIKIQLSHIQSRFSYN